jgi:hypothetical protein
MHRVQIKENFQCFKCGNVIPGPYSALTRHFLTDYGFKTKNVMMSFFVGKYQNGCMLKFNTFANVYHHLNVCEKNTDIVVNDVNDPIPIN